jgi:hypothetical protein
MRGWRFIWRSLRRRWVATILLLHVLLCLGHWRTGQDWGGDWAAYLMQAETLVQGNWVELRRQTQFRQSHSQPLDSPDYYPWGFAMWLLPSMVWGKMALPLAKLSLIACNVAILLSLRAWLRPYLTPAGQAALLGWLAAHPWLVSFPQQILADLPFWLASIGYLWAADRWVLRQAAAQRLPWQGLALGALLFATLWLRSQGWVWVLSLPLLQCVARLQQPSPKGWEQELLPYLSLALLWLCDRLSLPHGPGYLRFFFEKPWWETVPAMATYYAKVGYKFFEHGPAGANWTVPSGVLSLALTLPWATLGLWRSLKPQLGWFLASGLMLAVLLVYPFKEGFRFLFPLLPAALFIVIKGVEGLRGPWRRLGRGWLIVLIGSSLLASLGGVRQSAEQAGPHQPEAEAVWAYLETATDQGSSVTFSKPRILTWRCDRPAAFALSRHYPDQQTDLLLVPSDTLANLLPPVAQWLAQQPLRFENEAFRLYELRAQN